MSAARVQSSTDIRVPITTYLHPTAYRRLAAYAENNHTTVGRVLAQLADKATTPRKRRRPKVIATPEQVEWIITQHALGTPQLRIAQQLGISITQVNKRLQERGVRDIDIARRKNS